MGDLAAEGSYVVVFVTNTLSIKHAVLIREMLNPHRLQLYIKNSGRVWWLLDQLGPKKSKSLIYFCKCKQIWDVWRHTPHIPGLSAMTGAGLIRVIMSRWCLMPPFRRVSALIRIVHMFNQSTEHNTCRRNMQAGHGEDYRGDLFNTPNKGGLSAQKSPLKLSAAASSSL